MSGGTKSSDSMFAFNRSHALITDDESDSEVAPSTSGNIDESATWAQPLSCSTNEESTSDGDTFVIVDDSTTAGCIDDDSPLQTSPTADMMASDGKNLTNEMEYLDSLGICKALMTNVLKTSFVANEIVKVINLIGKDQDVTTLYETTTSVKHWRMAISSYVEPVYEHAMFGVIKWTLNCPLDRIVYAMLVGQSLTVVYNTYKSWMTPERMNSITQCIHYAEDIRQCIKQSDGDSGDGDKCTKANVKAFYSKH